MEFDTELQRKSVEIQQQWHGWGSPVGVSVLIVAVGVFIALGAWAGSLYQ
ncbi:hypothetical protein [Pseudophaeobacter sp.]